MKDTGITIIFSDPDPMQRCVDERDQLRADNLNLRADGDRLLADREAWRERCQIAERDLVLAHALLKDCLDVANIVDEHLDEIRELLDHAQVAQGPTLYDRIAALLKDVP